MRKISSLLVAAALIATASFTAFADDASVINKAEQRILDELAKEVTMSDGSKWVADTAFYNRSKNYFATVDVTDEQADAVIVGVNKVQSILANSDINDATVKSVSQEKRTELLAAGREAVAPLGLEMNYDYVEKQLVVTDKAGEVVDKEKPALEQKSTEKPTDGDKTTPTDSKTNPTQGGTNSGSGTNSGNNSGKTVTDDVIKTTGAGVDTSAVAGVTAAGIVVAAAGAAYAFKTRKERA